MEKINIEHDRAFYGLAVYLVDMIDKYEEKEMPSCIILGKCRNFLIELAFEKGKSFHERTKCQITEKL